MQYANDAQVIAVTNVVATFVQSITKSGRNYFTANEVAQINECLTKMHPIEDDAVAGVDIELQRLIDYMLCWDNDELASIMHDTWLAAYKCDVITHLNSLKDVVIDWGNE